MEAGSLDAPDLAGAVEAWRAWRIVKSGDELRLGSVVQPTVWPVGEPLVASCLRPAPFRWFQRRHIPEPAPEPACECGIYAAWLEGAGSYLKDASDALSVGRVIGQVSLWGTVVECERGFRASHAYPLALYVLRDSVFRRKGRPPAEIAAGLAAYGVPVEILDVGCSEAVSALVERQLRLTENADR